MTGPYTHTPRSDLGGLAPLAHAHAITDIAGLAAALSDKAPLAGPTFSGTISVPLGSVGTPSLAFSGDGDTGLCSPGPDQAALVAGGAARVTVTLSGVATSGTLTNDNAGTTLHRFRNAGGYTDFLLERHGGTLGTPVATQANDLLGRYVFGGHTGNGLTGNRAGLWCRAAETFTATATGTQFEIWTTPLGTTTTTQRVTVEAGGAVNIVSGPLKLAGADVVTTGRHLQLRSYTVATLPSAAVAGQLICVSDGASNRRLSISDGVNWRFPDGAIVS